MPAIESADTSTTSKDEYEYEISPEFLPEIKPKLPESIPTPVPCTELLKITPSFNPTNIPEILPLPIS